MNIILLLAVILLFGTLVAAAIEVTKDGERTEVPVCGGFAGIDCSAKQWCDYPEGTVCGTGDLFGTCRPRPEVCTQQYLPVCGCDGKTYGNACEAAASGFDVFYPGPCRSEQKN